MAERYLWAAAPTRALGPDAESWAEMAERAVLEGIAVVLLP